MREKGMSARFRLPAPSDPSMTFVPSTAPALIFALVTAFFLIFAVVTALALSCLVPTLFLASWLAAKAAATGQYDEGGDRGDHGRVAEVPADSAPEVPHFLTPITSRVAFEIDIPEPDLHIPKASNERE